MAFDPVEELIKRGFHEVIVLDDEPGSLLFGIWPYRMEKPEIPANPGFVRIHPYYDASQKAYQAASRLIADCRAAGFPAELRDDIRVKPVFSRLKRFRTGRNTLHYLDPYGSRFHVQVIRTEVRLTPTDIPEPDPIPCGCGSCRACIRNCPTGALGEDGFHREKCIRNWMLNGKTAPAEIREAMGDRFLGCDECQICCPMNPAPDGEPNERVSLKDLLAGKAGLEERLGRNMTIRNRVLAQACLNAGRAADPSAFKEALERLAESPSETVREHARWALGRTGQEKQT